MLTRNCVLILPLLLAHALQAQPGKVIFEAWDAAYLSAQNLPNPVRTGYSLTRVQEVTHDGIKYLQTVIQLRLTVKRFADVIKLEMDTGDLESMEGKVRSVFMKQYLGKNQTNYIGGVVNGDTLQLTQNEKVPLKDAPWDSSVVSLFRQRLLFQEKNVKPGDEFAFKAFEPSINLVVTQHVKVMGEEEVELFGNKLKRKLQRVELKPEKVQNEQFPKYILWLDETRMPVRSEAELPFGKLILYRTTKEAALGQIDATVDIGIAQYVVLKQRIPDALDVAKAIYRIRIRDEDDDPAGVLVQDARQKVKKIDKGTIELIVEAVPIPTADESAKTEYTQSSYFINCGDAKVKEHTRQAISGESDPWKKALKIEKYVNARMKFANHEALATADHVARTLEGDCTEYAMLMAAMCRAADIPSRTAVGMIYADIPRKGPVFAFHMWTEVNVGGKWIPLDATLGRGYVGATHIKIADQSWHDERTMTPLLPLIRVLGKIQVDVLATTERSK
jgi:transglutaminase-like putative cysteine protease